MRMVDPHPGSRCNPYTFKWFTIGTKKEAAGTIFHLSVMTGQHPDTDPSPLLWTVYFPALPL